MPADPVVHVIDDDEAIRNSLAFLLDTANFSVSTYASAEGFLEQIGGVAAGCIITDIRMPEMSGLDLVRRLKELSVSLPVIVITGHADVPLAVEAMKAGVSDFIEKPFDDETLLRALGTALQRGQETQQDHAQRAILQERLDSLSTRERQVLEALVAGRPNKVIAYDLGISPRTVEIYRAKVMTKMAASSLSELVRMAMSVGLMGPRPI